MSDRLTAGFRQHLTIWIVLLSLAHCAFAADWPAFRGPNNDGIALDSAAPTRWGPDENVKWKVPLPRPGNGSPIVVAGRVLASPVRWLHATLRFFTFAGVICSHAECRVPWASPA